MRTRVAIHSIHYEFLSQSAESPDYSHLPPEQRRKKLQRLIDDIRKDITKEEESRYLLITAETISFKMY